MSFGKEHESVSLTCNITGIYFPMAFYFIEQKNNQISKKQKRKAADSDDSDSDSSSDSNSDTSDLEMDFHKASDNSGTDVDDSNPFGNDSDSDEGRETGGRFLFQKIL